MHYDPFRRSTNTTMSPAEVCFPITPNDGDDLVLATKAIYVGQGGDVALISVGGKKEVTFRNVPSGSVLDVRVRAVRSGGTTASDLVGLA